MGKRTSLVIRTALALSFALSCRAQSPDLIDLSGAPLLGATTTGAPSASDAELDLDVGEVESAALGPVEPAPEPVTLPPPAEPELPEASSAEPTDESESATPAAAPAPRAGLGLLGFYPLGLVPPWFGALQGSYLPYSGLGSFLVPELSRRIGPVRYGASLTGGVSYTDNVFGSSTDRQGDAIWSLTPAITLETGDRVYFSLLYAPTLLQYTRFSSESSVNQTLLGTFRVLFNRLSFGGSLGYTTRQGLFADTESLATQDAYAASVYATYELGWRTSLRLDYSTALTDNDPGGLNFDQEVRLTLGYQLTHTLNVGAFVAVGAGNNDSDNQLYGTAGLSAAYVYSPRLQITGSVGLQARDLSDSSGWGDSLLTPVFVLAGVWNPVDPLSLYVSGTRSVNSNSFDSDQTTITSSVGVGFSYRFLQRFTFSSSASAAYVEQIANSNAADDAEYLYAYGDAGLGYAVTRWLSARVFYSVALRSPISNAESFTRNTVGLSATVQF